MENNISTQLNLGHSVHPLLSSIMNIVALLTGSLISIVTNVDLIVRCIGGLVALASLVYMVINGRRASAKHKLEMEKLALELQTMKQAVHSPQSVL